MSGKAGPSSQDNLDGDPSAHGNALVEAITTALSWLTILPFKGASVFDRITGRRAIAALPVAGLVPAAGAVLITAGLFATTSLRTPTLYDVTPILSGVLIMVAAQILTRAMHLDGLADVADALGSYKPPEGAREVLRDPATGPMGVGTIALTMLTSATAFGAIAASVLTQWAAGQVWPGVVTLCLPFVISRAAATTASWRGFPPFSKTGFGALTAGTQSTVTVACWWALLFAVSGWSVRLVGVIACALSLGVSLLLTRHCVKRFDGVNGDVFGAIIEVTCAVSAVVLAMGF
ncbi:adenosylcobinamide-GDP ribazoletransferase [uncultured Corynebacterium sp.]|uniref:adenosylcobinamide-GDP ribazoletransferase n=1 Tax=uncultured Corynebacterium sp. TaxID=159447 RepID=UPI002633389F|nr:adenosylcobinamide-GDP ribazoletransferase [uncultured Corynebacterium sp.]